MIFYCKKSLLLWAGILFSSIQPLHAQSGLIELTTNGGTISANTNSGQAVRLLDNDTTTVWTSASTGVAGGSITIRVIYASPVPIVVTQYSLTVAGAYRDRDPKNWSITASNSPDFSSSVTIAGSAVTNQSFASGATRTLPFTNTGSFSYYRLSISAINGATTGTQLSEFHLWGPASANAMPPVAPQNLSGVAQSDSILLHWTDLAVDESGYVVEKSSNGVDFIGLGTLAANSTDYTDAGLAAYTGFYYRVRALGTPPAGNSAWSNTLYAVSSGTIPLTDITANNGKDSLSSAGSARNLFDDDINTKGGLTTSTGWIQFHSTYGAVVKQYSITSANNSPDKDPLSWYLFASDDGVDWDTLDTRTNEVFPLRLFTKGFTLVNSTAYRIYRLHVTANNGHDTSVQMAEIAFNALKGPYHFIGDFETTDVGFWRDGGSCTTCNYAIQKQGDTVRNGQYAVRFELRKNDPESNVGSWRSELALNTEPTLKAERWYGFSHFLPADYGTDPTPEILAQWHSSPDYAIGEQGGQSPSLALRTENGEWVVTWRWDSARITSPPTEPQGHDERYLGSYQRGVWTDWVFHVRWDYGSNGLLEVWQNGRKVMEHHGANAYNDSLGVYFKAGIYKAIWAPATRNQSTVDKRVVFIDDVRVGNETATYADVAPPRTGGYTYPVRPFTPGNLVVVRIGNDGDTLSPNANTVYLDEFTTNGALVRSILLPIAIDSANKMLTLTNSANEGLLTLSPDSTLLAIAGYNAPLRTTTPNTAAGTVIDRTIGIINGQGLVNTTQSINDYNSAPRSVVTNGSAVWLYGGGGGVRYLPLDAVIADTLQLPTASVQVLTSPDGKGINIADGQLYISQSSADKSRVMKAGTGLPTSSPQTAQNLAGVPTTGGTVAQFFLVKLGPTGTASDVLYYMNDGDSTGIAKYSLVSGTWTYNGNLPIREKGVGLTGRKQGNGVVLYASSPNRIYKYYDTSGFNNTISGDTLTPLTNGNGSKKKFRGIAFAPQAASALRISYTKSRHEEKVVPALKVVEKLSVHPNPGSNFIQVLHPIAERDAVISIFDTNGKLLQTHKVGSGQTLTTVNITKLPGGIYILSFYSGKRKTLERFMKK